MYWVWHFISSPSLLFFPKAYLGAHWQCDFVGKRHAGCGTWTQRTVLNGFFRVQAQWLSAIQWIGGGLVECQTSFHSDFTATVQKPFLTGWVRTWDIPWGCPSYMCNALLWRISFGSLQRILEANISLLWLWSKMAVTFGLPQPILNFVCFDQIWRETAMG